LSSWIGNCEIDLTIEDEDFARRMEAQYRNDLENATEIVLKMPRRRRSHEGDAKRGRRHGGGSSSRAAAGALRIANSIGAAITNRRVLGPAETAPLLIGGVALLALAALGAAWPRAIAWPLAVLGTWIGASLVVRYLAMRRRSPPPREE